jgi:hypothetical protein
MRRTTTKVLRTRRPPHEVFLMWGRFRSALAQHVLVLSEEDKDGRWHTVHATPIRGRPAPAVPT